MTSSISIADPNLLSKDASRYTDQSVEISKNAAPNGDTMG
jgi:hypothetical protein